MIEKPKFAATRTCTLLDANGERHTHVSLADCRDLYAYVLLGEPGSGKSFLFLNEAAACGEERISARDFIALNPAHTKKRSIYFIDGLDEVRVKASDGNTPLDAIRGNLERLGYPRFRLSCREADWLGDTDLSALQRIVPENKIPALHLNPLTEDNVKSILALNFEIREPEKFIEEAREFGFQDILGNPHSLEMLVNAVSGGKWPDTRAQVFENAIRSLSKESNREHSRASKRASVESEKLIESAGYLCAVQLLSGTAGFAIDINAADDQHSATIELDNPYPFPLDRSLPTRLFQSGGDEKRIPLHRTVAEYLAARTLSRQISRDGLPCGRVLALVEGYDGGIPPDLRGLVSWLAVASREARLALIEKDPLGVLLYGDIKSFSAAEKCSLFTALKGEANRFAGFRFGNWSSKPFGALGTKEMEPFLAGYLSSGDRDDESQSFIDCVVDAISAGERMPSLDPLLLSVFTDSTYWSGIRRVALSILLKHEALSEDILIEKAGQLSSGLLKDDDAYGLLATMLLSLYPKTFQPSQIFTYLRPEAPSVISSYYRFWASDLVTHTPDSQLPELLDVIQSKKDFLESLSDDHSIMQLRGRVLAKGLEKYGHDVPIERLYAWLGIGLDKYGNIAIDSDELKPVQAWIGADKDRYVRIVKYGYSLAKAAGPNRDKILEYWQRTYDALIPAGVEEWYLEQGRQEADLTFARYYFDKAVQISLNREGRKESEIDALVALANGRPEFQSWLEPYLVRSLDSHEHKFAAQYRKRQVAWRANRSKWIKAYREDATLIRSGLATPKAYYDIANAYGGHFSDIRGDTPVARMRVFLDNDETLIDDCVIGLATVLTRSDLPSIQEIIDLRDKGTTSHIHVPCLVAAEMNFEKGQSFIAALDSSTLGKLAAFQIVRPENRDARWFLNALKQRPDVLAPVIVECETSTQMARHSLDSLASLLANDENYADIAKLAIGELVAAFPEDAKLSLVQYRLLPLLRASIRYLAQNELLTIVEERLKLKIGSKQRLCWLVAGLLIRPGLFDQMLREYIGAGKVRRRWLVKCIGMSQQRMHQSAKFPISTTGLLIELVAPISNPERFLSGGRTTSDVERSDMARALVNSLGNESAAEAGDLLERFITLPVMAHWRNALKGALYTHRISRRKSQFRPLKPVEISHALCNLAPVSAADLSAIVVEHLSDIGRQIRDGRTDDYKQYWSYGPSNRKLEAPKPENDCRDALLSDLNSRLAKHGVEGQPEGRYAEETRADIRVSQSLVPSLNIPIEIKRDSHKDLWIAIELQLQAKYIRDPGTDGYGIFLVFWFGGKGMPIAPNGTKPKSAVELRQALQKALPEDRRHQIAVVVIDCALPK